MKEFFTTYPRTKDIPILCEWISLTQELPLISSEKGVDLSTNVCQHWVDSAIEARVIAVNGKPIAFATLTRAEADLSEDSVELCHLIVHPSYRRHYNGSRLILELTSTARDHKFKKLFGRVAHQNTVGLATVSSLNWRPFTLPELPCVVGCSWYYKLL